MYRGVYLMEAKFVEETGYLFYFLIIILSNSDNTIFPVKCFSFHLSHYHLNKGIREIKAS